MIRINPERRARREAEQAGRDAREAERALRRAYIAANPDAPRTYVEKLLAREAAEAERKAAEAGVRAARRQAEAAARKKAHDAAYKARRRKSLERDRRVAGIAAAARKYERALARAEQDEVDRAMFELNAPLREEAGRALAAALLRDYVQDLPPKVDPDS